MVLPRGGHGTRMEMQTDQNQNAKTSLDAAASQDDPAIKLIISNDKIEAFLVVDGPLKTTEERIRAKVNQELISRKIVSGIETQAVEQCISELAVDGQKKYVIARGIPPVPGKDSEVVLKNDGNRPVPTVIEYLRMDQRSREAALQVEAGDLVAIRIPAVKGQEGRAVTGEPIPALPVQDALFKLGQNLRIASGKEAKAKFSGTVCINNKKEIEIARLDIVVAEDKMQADLLIGGMAEVPKEEVRARISDLLRSYNIVVGIDEEAIETCLFELPSGEMKKYVIVRGKMPGPGADAKILYYLDGQEIGSFEEYAKIYSSDRNRDFHVRAGDVLAVKVPASKGSDGFTITGESLPASAVQDVSFRTGRNIRSHDDRIEAEVAGTILLNEREEIEIVPLQLSISPDKLEVSLVIDGPGGIAKEELRIIIGKAFARKKVTTGIDEAAIQESIDKAFSGGPQKCIAARGTAPKPGQDAAILIRPGDNRRIGTLDQFAKMDFKDRGTIIQVSQGEVLAIKTPMIKGEPGITVTGETLPAPPVRDAAFKASKNVNIINGERAESKISGAVFLNSQEQIEVSPVFVVQGDVDYSVGHISFDGLVQISGSVRSGFRIRAGSLIAGFIEPHTKIEVGGDMTVREGTVGSEVKVQGIMKSGYIRRSRIVSEGDIVVGTEIVDSNISSLGKVFVTRQGGRILNSTIMAKKGVETYNLGSEASQPCDIILGVDYRNDADVETLNEEILQSERNVEKLENKFKEITQLREQVEWELQPLKRALPASKDSRQKYRLHMQYKDLCVRYKELERNCNLLLDAIVTSKGVKSELETKRQELLSELRKIDPGIYLTIKGTAFERNRIRGKISLLDVPETTKCLRAHETVVTQELEDGREEETIEIRLIPL